MKQFLTHTLINLLPQPLKIKIVKLYRILPNMDYIITVKKEFTKYDSKSPENYGKPFRQHGKQI